MIPGYLIVTNISKRCNVGNMLRSAVAMGFDTVLVVGMQNLRKKSKLNMFGSKGSDKHIPIICFNKLQEVKEWLTERNVKICGVEIVKDAKPVHTHPFTGPTAIMLGNEGSGLSENQIAICDHFVYIEQYGTGTASLNVTVAASIVMHHFSLWAGYEPASRESGRAKFVVAELSHDHSTRTDTELEIRKNRANKVNAHSVEVDDAIETVGTLFNDEE